MFTIKILIGSASKNLAWEEFLQVLKTFLDKELSKYFSEILET